MPHTEDSVRNKQAEHVPTQGLWSGVDMRINKSNMFMQLKRVINVVPGCLSITLGCGRGAGRVCHGCLRHLSCAETLLCLFSAWWPETYLGTVVTCKAAQALASVHLKLCSSSLGK